MWDLARFLLTGHSTAAPFPDPDFYPSLCPAGAPPRPAPAVIDLYLEFGSSAARAAAPRAGPCRDALRAKAEAGGGLEALYALSRLVPLDALSARFARAGAVCAAGHRQCEDAAGSAVLAASLAAYEGDYDGVRLVIEHADHLAIADPHGYERDEARRIQAAVGAAYGHPAPPDAPRARAYAATAWLDTEHVREGRAPRGVLAAAEACRGVEVLSFASPPTGLDDPQTLRCWAALAELDPHRVFGREETLLIALHQARRDGAITEPGDISPFLAGADRDVLADVLYTFDFEAMQRDAFNCSTPSHAYRAVWESLPHGPDSAVCARLSGSGAAVDDFAAQAALFEWTGCPVEDLLNASWRAGRVLKIRTRAGEARAFQCVYAVAQAAAERGAAGLSSEPQILVGGVRLGHLPEAALDLARQSVLFDFAAEAAADAYGHLPGWRDGPAVDGPPPAGEQIGKPGQDGAEGRP